MDSISIEQVQDLNQGMDPHDCITFAKGYNCAVMKVNMAEQSDDKVSAEEIQASNWKADVK